ncbi:MAG TPA: erythromycin esterase family protein [Gemmatimonadaceae bacterium]|nr:erythromycin esterase family protein [Gemmatimonadaceae bacterium]
MHRKTLHGRTARQEHRVTPADVVARALEPLHGGARDYDALLDLVGDATFVLIGEASHGTQEFYAERATITRRLIEEKEFAAVCIEGDWPDARRVDCFVKCLGDDRDADQALEGFRRFPTWMWRNDVVRDFVSWLRTTNETRPDAQRVGFFGLDLYSMFGSIQSVLAYLDRVDPGAAKQARYRYACFEHFGDDSQAYGYATSASLADPCEDEAVRALLELRQKELDYVSRDGRRAADDFFSAEQNARLVRNAEHYYRSMYRGRVSSWNLRDRHMADTLDAVHRHLQGSNRFAKVVVWAHNSHLGDARHTDMKRRGELNLGQLARERYGRDAVRLIGFSTHTGSVTAAHDWDEPGLQRRVVPSLAESCERVLHDASARLEAPRAFLRLRDDNDAVRALTPPRLQRAIGVVYRPETERWSHYYDVVLPKQFDAIIHIDETTALRALEPGEEWEAGVQEPPEAYPSGL